MKYIIDVKPGGHKYLFDWIKDLKPILHQYTDDIGTHHEFRVYTQVSLNDAHHEYRVNVLDYWKIKKMGVNSILSG